MWYNGCMVGIVEPVIETPEERQYRIPECNIEALETRIEKLSKRALRLGLPPVTVERVGDEFELWIDRDRLDPDSQKQQIKLLAGETIVDAQRRAVAERRGAYTPFVVIKWFLIRIHGGRPKLAGWDFVATIEHTEAGNILRTVPGFPEQALPLRFRKATQDCDHCRTNRNRTDTYVVRHEDGRFNQIGRDCLKDFLGHADPHFVAQMAEILSQVVEMYGNPDDDEGFGGSRGERYFPLLQILTVAATVIRLEGFTSKKNAEMYQKQATSVAVMSLVTPTKEDLRDRRWLKWAEKFVAIPADSATAEATTMWAQGLPEDVNNDYLWSVRVVAHLEAIRWKHTGIAVAMVSSYQRELDKQLQRERETKNAKLPGFAGLANCTHINCQCGHGPADVLEQKKRKMLETTAVLEGLQVWPDNGYGPTYFHRFVDSEGNVLTWKASRDFGFEQGHTYQIRGKVMDHEIYRGKNKTMIDGIKQTKLSLVKMQKDLTAPAEPLVEEA